MPGEYRAFFLRNLLSPDFTEIFSGRAQVHA
jgi:hypothetical protein